MGVVMVTRPIKIFSPHPKMSLKWLKLETLNFVHWWAMLGKNKYTRLGMTNSFFSHDFFNVGKCVKMYIIMVSDGDIVTMED